MPDDITRRTFLTSALYGFGGLTFLNGFTPFLKLTEINPFETGVKKLIATTDFIDNITINHKGSRYGVPVPRTEEYYRLNKCYMNRTQLDELHKILASIGVTRHQWIVDTIWNMYEDYPHGFDLLAEAARSAHKYGIEFIAEIKPFEGGGFGTILPHSMPMPKGSVALKDIRGIHPRIRPFVVENSSMNLKYRNGAYECNEPIKSIRLVKGDDRQTRIQFEHLSLWTSPTNNAFIPYEGALSFRETIEKRYRFPYWRNCRVLHLENLEIPEGHRYFLIRCAFSDSDGDFSDEKGNIIELIGEDGKILPKTLSTGKVNLEEHYESLYMSKIMRQLVRYLKLPEVQAEINDLQKMQEHYRNFYNFGEYTPDDWITFDKEGYVAVVCGKPEYMIGNLNPVYLEVRKHWLDMVQFCLNRGVDGINFRIANHTSLPEYWDYGFNELVVKKAEGKIVSRINGEAYTLFLKEARQIIKEKGKKIIVHLHSDMLMPDNRPGKLNTLPPNFEWQWETWVKEIADELEFRGVYKLRPRNLDKALEIFSTATQEVNKPFYFQGDFHGVAFEKPFISTESELELVKNRAYIDGYILYETANFTRINDDGVVEASPELLNVLREKGVINKIENK